MSAECLSGNQPVGADPCVRPLKQANLRIGSNEIVGKKARWLLAVTALALAALACSVDTSTGGGGGGSGSSARDLSREYEVTGVNMQGNRYSGEATLTRISGNQYAVNWLIADSAQTGAGTLDGDTFTPTWSDGQVSGTASYTVQPDGTLEGTWTQDGVSGEGTETLTPR